MGDRSEAALSLVRKRFVLGLLLCASSCRVQPALETTATTTTAAASRGWTVLLYAAVDNDWERDFMRELRALRRGLAACPDAEVLLLIDRSPKYSRDAEGLGSDFADTRLYRLTGGGAERMSGEPELAGLSAQASVELDTGDARVLRDFVRFGKRRFPSRHVALWLVSHGEGPSCCPDETDGGDELFTEEIAEVLTENESVDVLGFDACLMAGIENAYAWRRRPERFGADFLLASATVSNSWPYEDIFKRFRPEMSPRELSVLVVEEIRRQIEEGRSGDRGLERDLQSFGAFDLSAVAEAKRRLDALARRLWKDGAKAELLKLRGSGLEAKTFVYVWPERDANVTMPFVDAAHLCERIAASEAFSAEARALAARAAEAIDAVVASSCGFAHYAGFAPGRHGLSLVFPENAKTDDGRSAWERTGWYTPLPVAGKRDASGRYAWCIDGAVPANGDVENWFELMDAWLDVATADAPGGANGYAW